MRILVTGSEGFIGAVLVPYLIDHGHTVIGLDTGFYTAGQLYHDGRDRPLTLARDIRTVSAADLDGFDAVVHLAELSNDPLGSNDPATTFDINHRGSLHLARTAKAAGVKRFVYASSCSVYGAGSDAPRTETDRTAPLTPYAECKLLVEAGLAALDAKDFVTTCLRNATAFGASPRIRFDVVVNNLAGRAWTESEIPMTSDGTPWRPLVHILDISQAIEKTLVADADAVRGQIFNVGDDEQNYRVSEIAEIIQATFPGCRLSLGRPNGDNRSYRVDFGKIRRHLPDFACLWRAHDGARQLRGIFHSIGMTSEVFMAAPFTRLAQLKALVTSGQVNASLYWRPVNAGLAPPFAQAAQ